MNANDKNKLTAKDWGINTETEDVINAFKPFAQSSTPPSSPYVGQFSTNPDDEEQPTVHIHLDYDTAFNVLRNGLHNEADNAPMTTDTSNANATNLLRLLMDASKANRESDHPTQPTQKEIEEEAMRLWNKGAVNGTWNWHQIKEDTRTRFRQMALDNLTNPKN